MEERNETMDEFATAKWYTLQVMSGKENKVFQSLENRRNRDIAQGIDLGLEEILIPTRKIFVPPSAAARRKAAADEKGDKPAQKEKGRKDYKEEKLYPGYVFVKARLYESADKVNPETWSFIKNTPGVINFMGGEKPIRLTEDEITNLLQKNEEGEKPAVNADYNVGDWVRVKESGQSYSGVVGKIESIDMEKQRLKIAVPIFGRQTICEAEIWQVEHTESKDGAPNE